MQSDAGADSMAAQAPGISPIGTPRPGVRFHQVGTLHGDGTFGPLQHLVAVKLRSDCKSVLVGVAVKPMSELR